MANCTKCGAYLSLCKCVDLPKEEANYWWFVNRWAEEMARWFRALGIIIVLIAIFFMWAGYKAHAEGRSDFFKSLQLTPDAKKRLGYYSSCCDSGDVVHTKFKVNSKNATDEWWYEWKGAWKKVPPDIVDPERRSPYGALLFVSINDRETPVCFIPPDGGI